MKTNAAERYLLGELTETEANSFENHFFDCRVCAEDIRQGARMLEAGREVVKDETRGAQVVPLESRRKRRPWIAAAVAAALVVGIGLPSLIRQWQKPQKIEFATLYLNGPTRGAADENVVALHGRMLSLRFDVPSTQPFPRYVATVVDERGKAIASEEIAGADTEEPVTLLLRDLPAGSYGVVIEGVREDGKRSKVTTLPFRVLSKEGP